LAMGDLKFSLKIAWLLWMGLFDWHIASPKKEEVIKLRTLPK
jgi:hypothetical protein